MSSGSQSILLATQSMNADYLRGNELLQSSQSQSQSHSGCFESALHCYESALQTFAACASRLNWVAALHRQTLGDNSNSSSTNKNEEDLLAPLRALLLLTVRCCLNSALCSSKQRNDGRALEHSSAALDYLSLVPAPAASPASQPSTGSDVVISEHCQVVAVLRKKALLRRSVAYESTGDYARALADWQTIGKEFVQDVCWAQKLRQLTALNLQDKNIAHGEGKPMEMVNHNQALRLNLLQKMPDQLCMFRLQSLNKQQYISTMLQAKLTIGNEIGLFQRKLFGSEGQLGELRIRPKLFATNNCEFHACVVGVENLTSSDISRSDCSWNIPQDGKLTIHFWVVVDCLTIVDQLHVLNSSILLVEFWVSNFVREDIRIIPVNSCPIRLHTESMQRSDFDWPVDILQSSCIRSVNFSVVDTTEAQLTVYSYENPGLLGTAGKVWDSSFILISYLSHFNMELINGKRVLELGSGTGVTGLAVAFLKPQQVTMTDFHDVLPLIDANINLNKLLTNNIATVQDISAVELDWASDLTTHASKEIFKMCDIIIASDVIYYPEGYLPLVNTIIQLLVYWDTNNTHQKQLILAHRHRHPQDANFFDLIKSRPEIVMEELQWKQLLGHPQFASLGDVRLFKIIKS